MSQLSTHLQGIHRHVINRAARIDEWQSFLDDDDENDLVHVRWRDALERLRAYESRYDTHIRRSFAVTFAPLRRGRAPMPSRLNSASWRNKAARNARMRRKRRWAKR